MTAIDRESLDVLSLTLQSTDGQPLPSAQPGQFVVVRLQPTADSAPLFRSYSLSGPPSTETCRISVKIEPNGAAGTYLSEQVRVGDNQLSVPRDADAYLCGPAGFMADVKEALIISSVRAECIHVEFFGGSESMTPGVVGGPMRASHPPQNDANTGPLVSFARSGIAAYWNASAYQSILELAEACDVQVRWSSRTGVCHSCESGLVSGAVVYRPEPLDKPADGNVLVCCSQPSRDVVIDL